ncbi:MAG: penicillin-binding protein [candidate division NC10 bacterium]|nr:penicillin-binding protein [candidate division NC10 bacterium]
MRRNTHAARAAPCSRARVLVLFCVVASFFGLVTLKLFSLQVKQHQRLLERADRQHRRIIPLAARRGTILDRHGRELAVSLEAASAFAQPVAVKDPGKAARELSPILHLPPSEILKKLKDKKSFVWLKRRIDPDQARAVERLRLKGIHLIPESKRYYPKQGLAAHALGFVGMDDRGLEGLEYHYDALLGGGPRWAVSYQDALGRPIFKEGEANPGYNLKLTIDEFIQYIAERELERAVEKAKALGGTAIVMDPMTGEILALASFPTFDPNRYQASPAAARRNRATVDVYEPGSTFKVIMAAAALEEGRVTLQDRFYGEQGAIQVGRVTIRDHEPYGWLTFGQVLAYSSNVGAIKVGTKLGKSLSYSYISSFGFGSPTGIDLPGESPGLIRRPKSWSQVSLGALSIGQEIAVTPIQLATAMAGVANGGVLVRPFLMKEVIAPDGKVLKVTKPLRIRRVLSEATSRTLTDLLKMVVTEGTGKLAALEGYEVSGKTGTAQKLDQATGHYSRGKLIASFVGFVPAGAPKLLILVMIDEPKGEAWGGTVAAPTFREIALGTLKYLKIPPSPGDKVHVALKAEHAVSRLD